MNRGRVLLENLKPSILPRVALAFGHKCQI
jgi:hypothetical protein